MEMEAEANAGVLSSEMTQNVRIVGIVYIGKEALRTAVDGPFSGKIIACCREP